MGSGVCCGGGAVEGEGGRDRDMIGSSQGLVAMALIVALPSRVAKTQRPGKILRGA